MIDELPLERPLEDGLAKEGAACRLRGNGLDGHLNHRLEPLGFLDDAFLLPLGWNRDGAVPQLGPVDVGLPHLLAHYACDPPTPPVGVDVGGHKVLRYAVAESNTNEVGGEGHRRGVRLEDGALADQLGAIGPIKDEVAVGQQQFRELVVIGR